MGWCNQDDASCDGTEKKCENDGPFGKERGESPLLVWLAPLSSVWLSSDRTCHRPTLAPYNTTMAILW